MKEYFYRREYKYMYASIFFYNFAYALIETFGAVMLYQAGLPIYMILLIYTMRCNNSKYYSICYLVCSDVN